METPSQHSQTGVGFYEAEVDLIASEEAAQCPFYFTLSNPAPLGLDAIAHACPRLCLYAFALIALLPGLLARVRQQNTRLLLMVPHWPTTVWFSDLTSLLDSLPWAIPLRMEFLSQGCLCGSGSGVFHPCVSSGTIMSE